LKRGKSYTERKVEATNYFEEESTKFISEDFEELTLNSARSLENSSTARLTLNKKSDVSKSFVESKIPRLSSSFKSTLKKKKTENSKLMDIYEQKKSLVSK
jgi:hypothetical protein